ncbi:MAG: Uroporphyrinogen-III synthase [Pseudomonadota bacterium]
MISGADMALACTTSDLAASWRVIVTRPVREAQAWADALRARGVRCESLPLIEIAAWPDAGALVTAWQAVSQQLAVMFVSANAVRFFMAARPTGWPMPSCRAWSTGPGTRAALLAAGWPEGQIDSPGEDALQFDSEALWALVAQRVRVAVNSCPSKPSVLIVRGADAQGQLAGRDWLAQQLERSGLEVLQAVAYVRRAPVLTPEQRSLALQAAVDGSAWLFSSSEAALHLLQACPDVPLAQARALATHPRIAERLQQLGWRRVDLVPAGIDAQAQSIKSIL